MYTILKHTLHIHILILASVTLAVPEGNETERLPYVRKCCNLNESIPFGSETCEPSYVVFNPEIYNSPNSSVLHVDLVVGEVCKYGKYRLEPETDKSDEFFVTAEGYLSVPSMDEQLINPKDYCLENFGMEDGSSQILPLICFPAPAPTPFWKSFSEIVFPIGCFLSVPFLLAVVIVFYGIPELRDNYGMVLGFHAGCLAVAYTSLAAVQVFGTSLSHDACVSMAHVIQFSFIACFMWLNLLCYHTWKKYTKGLKMYSNVAMRKVVERKTFIKYNIYAWSVPVIILIVTLFMDHSTFVQSTLIIKPNVGLDACWFQGDKAVLPYFYGPIAILLSINIVFFLLTARYLHNSSKKKKMQHLGDVVNIVIRNRRRKLFFQCLIIFCAMGLNWILELLSWAIGGPSQIWILTDIINTLQGPIIFWIFVWKDNKVRNQALSKFCSHKSTKQQENGQLQHGVGLMEVT